MIICVFLVEMGSDANLFAVKLVKFASQKYAKKKINSGILKLCKSIISICYSNCSQRTQKKFCAFTIRASCSAFSAKPLLKIPRRWQLYRKFYGCHFHCMIVHAPQTHRIFCLRSLVQELEERSFCDLRRISLNISNQQCGKVIENAILGFNTQQQTDRGESYRKQETIISQQAKLLPQSEDTKFSLEIWQSLPYLFQTHCQRTADFLLEGQNTWWSTQGWILYFTMALLVLSSP